MTYQEEDYEEIQMLEGGVIDLTDQNLNAAGINERFRNINEYIIPDVDSRLLLAGVTNEAPDSSSGGINGLVELDGLLIKKIINYNKMILEPVENPDGSGRMEITYHSPFWAAGWKFGAKIVDMLVPSFSPIEANEIARGEKGVRDGLGATESQQELIDKLESEGMEVPDNFKI